MTILYDVADPAVLTTIVRELPEPNGIGLNAILPDRLFDSAEAVWDVVSRTNRAAKFRAFDAESPIGKRDSAARKSAPMQPLSQKTVIGEWETLQRRAMQMGGNAASQLESEIYNEVRINADAVRIRAEYARGNTLVDGVFAIDENGVTESWDYGVPGANIVTAAITWATATTDIPADINTWLDVWYAAGGGEAILTVSRAQLANMLKNDKIRALGASNGVTPSVLSQNGLQTIFDGMNWPTIRVYDASFDIDGSTTRVLAADKALLTPANPLDLGFTAWGMTAEAIELAEAQRISIADAPGLVSVVMKTEDPVARWTKVGGTVLPVLTNPNRLMVWDTVT